MKLGIITDIHGNDVALRAVVKDAEQYAVDCWWALGDLVLFGPRPAETLDILRGLPGISMLRGNTDRYVLTGEQPSPHATAADAAASVDLVERYAAMAAGIAWTRGVLDQAGLLAEISNLPAQLRLRLRCGCGCRCRCRSGVGPGARCRSESGFLDGARVLGVHASMQSDDGPGIDPELSDERLRPLLADCDADIVVGGHTHIATDRLLDGIRVLNPGSVGVPRTPGNAGWLLLEDADSAATIGADNSSTFTVTHRTVRFDVNAVVDDLRRRRHPNAQFMASILTGQRPQVRRNSGG